MQIFYLQWSAVSPALSLLTHSSISSFLNFQRRPTLWASICFSLIHFLVVSYLMPRYFAISSAESHQSSTLWPLSVDYRESGFIWINIYRYVSNRKGRWCQIGVRGGMKKCISYWKWVWYESNKLRKAHIDTPSVLYHITCRGIECRKIFCVDADRDNFLDRLGNILKESSPPCYSWALIPNHLLLWTGKVSITDIIRRLLTCYAVRFNRRCRRLSFCLRWNYALTRPSSLWQASPKQDGAASCAWWIENEVVEYHFYSSRRCLKTSPRLRLPWIIPKTKMLGLASW